MLTFLLAVVQTIVADLSSALIIKAIKKVLDSHKDDKDL